MTSPNQHTPSIAVIREGKTPPDARVPLTPNQVARLRKAGYDIVVQPSPKRAFQDDEYARLGIPLVDDIRDRQLLLGIKEVPINELIPGKTYCNFAHVAKEQEYNRDLLRAFLEKNITQIDYEYLTDENGRRLIAFGYWAGMVGAHNAIWTYARRHGGFALPRLKDLHDYAEAKTIYVKTELPADLRVVLTGTGRVGRGAAQVLTDMGLRKVTPSEFLTAPEGPVFTQLAVENYAYHPGGKTIDRKHFYANSQEYKSAFLPYARVADVFINGIFWDGKAPAFFNREQMLEAEFGIATVADITCDIAPAASVPTTLRPSTIADPVFGYDPKTGTETDAFAAGAVDVMAIDNLPSELPRDASKAFGEIFIEKILPEFNQPQSDILDRATITKDGALTERYGYLKNFALR